MRKRQPKNRPAPRKRVLPPGLKALAHKYGKHGVVADVEGFGRFEIALNPTKGYRCFRAPK